MLALHDVRALLQQALRHEVGGQVAFGAVERKYRHAFYADEVGARVDRYLRGGAGGQEQQGREQEMFFHGITWR